MVGALIWLSVALGLAAKSVETASNTPMFLILLPFLGSGFVPAHSMPVVLRWFAQYQPFTPITETVRHLLLGGPVGVVLRIRADQCDQAVERERVAPEGSPRRRQKIDFCKCC